MDADELANFVLEALAGEDQDFRSRFMERVTDEYCALCYLQTGHKDCDCWPIYY
jgi:hypothetical protein